MQHINISEKLKILMNKYNMSLSEFAKFTGVSRTSLSGYINDKVSPTIDPMVQICQKCGVSMDWLCSNPSTKHFVNGTDITDLFLELQTIPGFDYEIDITTDDLCDTACLKFEGERKASNEKVFDITKFITFLKELSEIHAKFEILNDPEFTKSYYDMWLEKKRSYYSTLKVEYPGEREDRIELELFNNLPDGMKSEEK